MVTLSSTLAPEASVTQPARATGRGPFSRAGAYLVKMLRVWRERQELLLLEDRDLRDIGLTRFDVAREVNRPFWDTRSAF